MAIGAPTTGTWSWPPNVLALAAELGVTEYLEPVFEMTRRVFPNAHRVSARVEDDWEIANECWISIEVQEVGLTADLYLKRHEDWCKGLFEVCPAPNVCTFVLALDPTEQ
jgi:hypothetical protein